ncbi:MAG: DHH family phosphoesterase [Desulfonatronovibrionaceae bacterium]
MAYFRNLDNRLQDLGKLLRKDERWLILMNADPDALASAMALKRMIFNRVGHVGLAHVNEISRPDNLAMIKLLRIPVQRYTPLLAAQFDRFALVDSQPHHSTSFSKLGFSLIIDHHPLSKENPVDAQFAEIKPDYGSNSSILTEYLYNMKIRPGKLLATALAYGIKTDTQSFERQFNDVDIKAFRYLTKFYNPLLLRKIVRSELRKEWLKYFSRAFKRLKIIDQGVAVSMGEVDSPDILVILADFFLKVHNISWDVIGGVCAGKLVIILRGDGLRKDMGKMAERLFSDCGTAGGHRSMARAEINLVDMEGRDPQQFLLQRMGRGKPGLKAGTAEGK